MHGCRGDAGRIRALAIITESQVIIHVTVAVAVAVSTGALTTGLVTTGAMTKPVAVAVATLNLRG